MKLKKFTCMVLAMICLVTSCGFSAHAAETRASTQISKSTVNIGKQSTGKLNVFFMVRATGKMDIIGASKIEIQRSNGSSWVTEYTATPEDMPELQGEEKVSHSLTVTYSPQYPDKSYRAVVYIYVEDASGSSTKTLTSKTA